MTSREGRKSSHFLICFLFSNESKIFQCQRFKAQLGKDSFKLHSLKCTPGLEKKEKKINLNPYPFKVTGKSFKVPEKKEGCLKKRKGFCVSMWITMREIERERGEAVEKPISAWL